MPQYTAAPSQWLPHTKVRDSRMLMAEEKGGKVRIHSKTHCKLNIFFITVRPTIKRNTAQLSEEERTGFYPCPTAAGASVSQGPSLDWFHGIQKTHFLDAGCQSSLRQLWSIKVMPSVFFYFHCNNWHIQLGVGILRGDYSFCLRTLKNWVRGTNAAEEATGEQIALQKNKIYANGICWSLSRLKSNGLMNCIQHTIHRDHLQGEILFF